MNYLANGTVVFDSLDDLYYELFNEIGLAVGATDQYLYDQDTGIQLRFKEKFIKASINGQPIYQGKNDIAFDPQKNYSLMNTLFGYYLQKCQNSEDGDMLQGYIAHFIDDNPERDKQQVVVKTQGRGNIASSFYSNIFLAYIDCIFRIAGYIPDLSNFDIVYE